jgi:beta-lactamase regulating signal transducer with metallopeptidase domain
MNIQNFMSENLLQALGWTVIHSLWQITLIGIVLKISLRLMKNQAPSFRYHILLMGVFSIIVASGFTFYKIMDQTHSAGVPIISETMYYPNEAFRMAEISNSSIVAYDRSLVQNGRRFIQQNTPVIALLWLVGFFIFSIRFAGGYWYLSRLYRKSTRANQRILEISNNIRRRLNLEKYVEVLESASVKVPIALGYLKPVIILPVGLATSIPYNQLEAIITHELAHIKRNDFPINLIKSILEAVYFYHPVFWWIGKQIDNEREHCCDDLTIALCENEKSLQEALLNIELHNQKLQHIAAALYKNKFQLLNRIKRMKTNDHLNHGNRKTMAGLFVLPALVIIFSISSAFVPRTYDMPDRSFQNNPAVPSGSEITTIIDTPANQAESLKQKAPAQEVSPVDKAEKTTVPDSTRVKYGSKIKTEDGYVLMEFDEEMNLQSITKDGKDLSGEEREKYEKIAEKSKKAYDAEILQKEKQKELQKLQEELKSVQEKMAQVQDEYNEIMKSYMEKAAISGEYVWPELYADVFDDAWKTQYEAFDDVQFDYPEFKMPEMPNVYFDEEAMKEHLEHSQQMYEETMRDFKLQQQEMMNQKEFQQQMKAMEREAREMGRTSRNMEIGFRKEMINDGLIDEWDDLESLKLTDNKLEINGQKQSKKLHEKYLQLYKKLTGKELEGQLEISGD